MLANGKSRLSVVEFLIFIFPSKCFVIGSWGISTFTILKTCNWLLVFIR